MAVLLAATPAVASADGAGQRGGRATADRELLAETWRGFIATFVTADGRVVRPEHGGDSVSEGQAYAALRAAWMRDQATFDRVWSWARTNLRRTGRPAPELMAWHWAPAPTGGVDDWEVATDADVDLAAALLLADEQWREPSRTDLPPYRDAARAILDDLLAYAYVVDADGRAFLLPGRWADERASNAGIVLNPSYLAPAWYRAFARATGDGRWTALATHAYDLLDAVCQPAQGLVAIPDWIRWHTATRWTVERRGDVVSGWDAVRVPWRVASDARWFRDSRARRVLGTCFAPFVRARATGGVAVEHDQDGRVQGAADHPLANALAALAAPTDALRDALLRRVESAVVRGSEGAYFGEADRYYVNSLAYLPFLARAGLDTRPRR